MFSREKIKSRCNGQFLGKNNNTGNPRESELPTSFDQNLLFFFSDPGALKFSRPVAMMTLAGFLAPSINARREVNLLTTTARTKIIFVVPLVAAVAKLDEEKIEFLLCFTSSSSFSFSSPRSTNLL